MLLILAQTFLTSLYYLRDQLLYIVIFLTLNRYCALTEFLSTGPRIRHLDLSWFYS